MKKKTTSHVVPLGTLMIFSITLAVSSSQAQVTKTDATAVGTNELQMPVPHEAPKKLVFAFITSSYVGVEAANKKQGDVTAYNQLRADYKIREGESVRLNQLFSNAWGAKNNGKSEVQIGDMYLQYSRQKLANLPSGITLSSYARTYLPLSNLSKQKGQNVALSGAAILEKEFSGDTSVALNLIPTVNQQTRSSYLGDDGTRKANSSGSFWYFMSYAQKLGTKVSFAQDLGLMRYWFRQDAENNVKGSTKEFLYADSSISFEATEHLEVALGVSSYLARDLMDQKNPFSVYRPDETDYYVAGTMRF